MLQEYCVKPRPARREVVQPRQTSRSKPDCARWHSIRIPLDQLWKEYSLVVQRFRRPHARALAGANARPARRARLAAVASVARRLPARRRNSPMNGRSGSNAWPRRRPVTRKSPCCRAPLLPLLTRDVRESGLICQHCNETLVPFDEIPEALRAELDAWAARYAPVHAVAHWDDRQRKSAGNYDQAYENAAERGRTLARRRPARDHHAEIAGILSRRRLGGPGRMPVGPTGGHRAVIKMVFPLGVSAFHPAGRSGGRRHSAAGHALPANVEYQIRQPDRAGNEDRQLGVGLLNPG